MAAGTMRPTSDRVSTQMYGALLRVYTSASRWETHTVHLHCPWLTWNTHSDALTVLHTAVLNVDKVIYVFVVSGKKSAPQWMDGMLKDQGVGFLVSRFEGGGLLSQPTLRDLSGPFSVRATLQWMDLLLAALDCYNTFINLHIIRPHHIMG